MLCVPRSWAASPWVIERMTVSLSAIWAVCGRVSLNFSPSILVGDRAHVAAVLDRGKRLGIERLLVGDPAGQEDVDHRVGLGRDRGVALLIGPGLKPEHVGEGQAPQPDRADRQEPTAIDRVEETVRLPSIRLLCSDVLRRGIKNEGVDTSSLASAGRLDRRGPVNMSWRGMLSRFSRGRQPARHLLRSLHGPGDRPGGRSSDAAGLGVDRSCDIIISSLRSQN